MGRRLAIRKEAPQPKAALGGGSHRNAQKTGQGRRGSTRRPWLDVRSEQDAGFDQGAELALVAAGPNLISYSTTSAKSTTTSASWKDIVKNMTDGFPKKSGLCCNPSCRQCTMVPCDTYHECKIFGVSGRRCLSLYMKNTDAEQYGCCCPSPPAESTDFSKNVLWGLWGDNDTYTLRKRVRHQLFPKQK